MKQRIIDRIDVLTAWWLCLMQCGDDRQAARVAWRIGRLDRKWRSL